MRATNETKVQFENGILYNGLISGSFKVETIIKLPIFILPLKKLFKEFVRHVL